MKLAEYIDFWYSSSHACQIYALPESRERYCRVALSVDNRDDMGVGNEF